MSLAHCTGSSSVHGEFPSAPNAVRVFILTQAFDLSSVPSHHWFIPQTRTPDFSSALGYVLFIPLWVFLGFFCLIAESCSLFVCF